MSDSRAVRIKSFSDIILIFFLIVQSFTDYFTENCQDENSVDRSANKCACWLKVFSRYESSMVTFQGCLKFKVTDYVIVILFFVKIVPYILTLLCLQWVTIFIGRHADRDLKGNDDFFDTSSAENLKDNLAI